MPVGRAAQQIECLLLAGAERRAGELFGALRGERATRTVRDASAVPLSGRVSVIRPSCSSADEGIAGRRARACAQRRRPTTMRPPVSAPARRAARRAPAAARASPRIGDPRVALALDPRARRHRRRDRFADAARVVLGHPARQANDVRRQEGLAVEDVDHGLQTSSRRPIGIRRCTDATRPRRRSGLDDAGTRHATATRDCPRRPYGPLAQRHQHARAAPEGRRSASGTAVGERRRGPGPGRRRATSAHERCYSRRDRPVSSARAFFMSSQASRLRSGLRSRKDGMERRDQLRAAEIVDAAAQARDRILGAEQRLRGERAERDDHLRRMASICGTGTARSVSTSSGSGLRLPGGRHLMTLAM